MHNIKKHLRDNAQIRAETKKLIRKIGVIKSADSCGMSPSALSYFVNDKRRLTIEKVVEIYEVLRGM